MKEEKLISMKKTFAEKKKNCLAKSILILEAYY